MIINGTFNILTKRTTTAGNIYRVTLQVGRYTYPIAFEIFTPMELQLDKRHYIDGTVYGRTSKGFLNICIKALSINETVKVDDPILISHFTVSDNKIYPDLRCFDENGNYVVISILQFNALESITVKYGKFKLGIQNGELTGVPTYV